MLTASVIATVLALATPSNQTVLESSGAKRDEAPQSVLGAVEKVLRPLAWGAVATATGVGVGVLSAVLGLGGALMMAAGYFREEGVPRTGVAGFDGDFSDTAQVNGLIFDSGKYGFIGAIFVGAFALIVTGAGLGLLVGALVVQE